MFGTWIFVRVRCCDNIFRVDEMKIIETKFGTYMERENDPTKLTGDKIKVFVERLKKLGIEIKLQGNFPWVYIDEICGLKVEEKLYGNHGFTLIFLPGRTDSPPSDFTDIRETFKLIRKYSRKALLIQLMKEDERDGMYDIDMDDEVLSVFKEMSDEYGNDHLTDGDNENITQLEESEMDDEEFNMEGTFYEIEMDDENDGTHETE